ncbi:1392_t:CDS:1 [Ambispora gerdemannii]|uniref:1392_t:CDS:1 n=1 Tax=Ambispora gerdemannii TaxID=144530 RepID=A0A9N9F803_9GLOM|nr:1392_t:CDS:1 [Ambispora gerdemannii]
MSNKDNDSVEKEDKKDFYYSNQDDDSTCSTEPTSDDTESTMSLYESNEFDLAIMSLAALNNNRQNVISTNHSEQSSTGEIQDDDDDDSRSESISDNNNNPPNLISTTNKTQAYSSQRTKKKVYKPGPLSVKKKRGLLKNTTRNMIKRPREGYIDQDKSTDPSTPYYILPSLGVHSSVYALYNEWYVGLHGMPSIRQLILVYGHEWVKENKGRLLRRKYLIDEIMMRETDFGTREALASLQLLKGDKSLNWLVDIELKGFKRTK